MTQDRKPSKGGQRTKTRILDAALKTVNEQGLVGTSARAIATTGDFNQALVFYHFGSIEGLLLAALQRSHDQRMEQFGSELKEAATMTQLIQIGQRLHATHDMANQAALAAIVAGWPATSEHGNTVLQILQPWNDLISGALERSIQGHPLANFVPTNELAYAVSALFLGLEVLDKLNPAEQRASRVFTILANLSTFAGPMLDAVEDPRP